MSASSLDLPTVGLLLLVAAVIGLFLGGAAAVDKAAASESAPRRFRRLAPIAAAVLAAWLLYTGLAAGKGLLLDPEALPPPFLRIMGPGLILVFLAAFSPFGGRLAQHLSYASLVGFHAFRIPLEGLLWWFHEQGRLPVQMTFAGRNPDILTGIGALILAILLKKGMAGKKAVMVWNLAGLALLLNIATVAVLSLPGRLRAFHEEPSNTLVLHFPYVWIPAIFVLAALLGHLILFRRFRQTAGSA